MAVLTTMCLYAVKQVSAQQAEPAATAVVDRNGFFGYFRKIGTARWDRKDLKDN
ncbi:hypothetical protein [Parapedobacter sp.]